MSPSFLAEHALFLGGTFFACMVLKFVAFSLVIILFKVPFVTSIAIGLSLTPISEFAFVILSTYFKTKSIKRHWYMLLLGVTGLSMFLSPFIVQIIKPLVKENEQQESSAGHLHQHQSPRDNTNMVEIEMGEKTAMRQHKPNTNPAVVMRKQTQPSPP